MRKPRPGQLALAGIAAVMLAAPLSSAEPAAETNAVGESSASTTTTSLDAKGTEHTGSTSSDGIPDILRDVLPKQDSQSQPQSQPQSQSQSQSQTQRDLIMGPNGSSHSPVQAGGEASSRPPVHDRGNAGSRPPVQTGEAPKKTPQPTIVLKGRLEEIGGSGAKLPVGVMLNLKTQTAHMDPAVEKQLAGKVASFPTDWAGSYGGTITIHSAQFDPLAYQFDQEETLEEQKLEAPGTQGTTTFNFFRQNNIIALQPATIMLPPRNDSPAARQMQEQLRNSPMAAMLGGNGGAMMSMLTTTQPMMVLGDLRGGTGVTGNTLSNLVVKNDIRQLKPGVLEQNLIVQESESHHQTGQVKRTYSETVLRFTRLNPRQLYVQAASIKYRHDGHFLTKVIMYGTVTRGVSGGSFPTGAFPGVDPSGAGGFGQINEMLKQLQGF